MILVRWPSSAGQLPLPMLIQRFGRPRGWCWPVQVAMGQSGSYAIWSSSIASEPAIQPRQMLSQATGWGAVPGTQRVGYEAQFSRKSSSFRTWCGGASRVGRCRLGVRTRAYNIAHPAKVGPQGGRNHQAEAPAYSTSQDNAAPRWQLSQSTFLEQLVEHFQPIVHLDRMEVIGLEPAWIGLAKSALSKIIERAKATGLLKYQIDHLLRDSEIRDDQCRAVHRHGLKRCGRGDRNKSAGGTKCVHHGASNEGDGVPRNTAGGGQVIHDVVIWPGLVVGLLFLGPGAKLDNGGPGVGQCQQDLFSVSPLNRHLRLRCKHQIRPELAFSHRPWRMGGQEGQRGQPEDERGRHPCPNFGEIDDFPHAVQQEQVARGSGSPRPAGRRHADPGQGCDQHGSSAAPEHPLDGQSGDDRSGAGQQDYVWALQSYPGYQLRICGDLHAP